MRVPPHGHGVRAAASSAAVDIAATSTKGARSLFNPGRLAIVGAALAGGIIGAVLAFHRSDDTPATRQGAGHSVFPPDGKLVNPIGHRLPTPVWTR